MKKLLALLSAILLATASARAQSVPSCPVPIPGGCGATIPISTPTLVFVGRSSGGAQYQRTINVGTTAGGTAWCSRWGAPVVNGAGSFPISPFGNSLGMPSVEEYTMPTSGAPPTNPLSCVSDGGTGGTSPALLTIETR